MKTKLLIVILIICAGFSTALGQKAVPKNDDALKPRPRRVNPFDSLYNSRKEGVQIDRLETARRLIAQGAYISAVGMLEDIYSERPDDRQVVDLLFLGYTELKAYSKAEMLVKRQLDKYPTDIGFNQQLLDLYMKMADDSLVNDQAHKIIDRYPGSKSICEQVIRGLKQNGYEDLGMEFIKKARADFNDPDMFILLAGNFYEVRRDYGKAVREYYRASKLDSLTASEADRRMGALIRYPDSPGEVIDTLEAILAVNPADTFALKFLSEAFIRQREFSEAFESTVKLDSLTGGDGRQVFNYMRRCRERGLYNEVVKVSEYLSRNREKKNIPYNFHFYYAEALSHLGRTSDAIAVYEKIERESPRQRDRAEALFHIGNVYRYDLKDYDSARVYYDSTMNSYGYTGIRMLARMEIAGLYLVQGDLDKAQEEYEKLLGEKMLQDNQERISYTLALIQLFRKNYKDADVLFRKLISDYPRGVYLNDAIVTSLAIRESAEMHPNALGDYADAIFYEVRLMPDSAEAMLKSVIERGMTPLLGTSMYRLAANYMNHGKEDRALDVVEKMGRNYSEDYFYPYCLKIKGDIYLRDESTRAEGVEIYKSILENYGNYPFIGEVREKLQELSGYLPAG